MIILFYSFPYANVFFEVYIQIRLILRFVFIIIIIIYIDHINV